jgi:hypothetical protein
MKRRNFLRHLAAHGCALLREGRGIPSISIRREELHPAFHVTQKSMTSSLGRFAAISEFLSLNKSDFYFSKYSCKKSTVA